MAAIPQRHAAIYRVWCCLHWDRVRFRVRAIRLVWSCGVNSQPISNVTKSLPPTPDAPHDPPPSRFLGVGLLCYALVLLSNPPQHRQIHGLKLQTLTRPIRETARSSGRFVGEAWRVGAATLCQRPAVAIEWPPRCCCCCCLLLIRPTRIASFNQTLERGCCRSEPARFKPTGGSSAPSSSR